MNAELANVPLWTDGPSFYHEIGDSDQGFTAGFSLSNTEETMGASLNIKQHWKLKPTDRGLPLSAFKEREDRWDRLYLQKARFVLDESEVVEYHLSPALSWSLRLVLPFVPTELRTEGVLTNGVVMRGEVRIAKVRKQIPIGDARYEVGSSKRTVQMYSDTSFVHPPRNRAIVEFRNDYPSEGLQLYNCHCISSVEAGPITEARINLSGHPGDPKNEPVAGRVTFSQPVYELNTYFEPRPPYGVRTSDGQRQVTFECITTLGKVIRAESTVLIRKYRPQY